MDKRAFLTAVIALLFLSQLIASAQLKGVTAQNRTLTVPTDFPTIQDAIGNATAGDTVFVKSGTYFATAPIAIVIDKSLSLIGEDPQSTIIDGQRQSLFNYPSNYKAVRVAVSNVTVSGFTITNAEDAIGFESLDYDQITHVSDVRIIGNILKNNRYGVKCYGNCLILGNNVTNNDAAGISIGGDDGVILENNITENNVGVEFGYSRNMSAIGNFISNNTYGLTLSYFGPYNISSNNITYNQYGLQVLNDCNNATIYGNKIEHNGAGIFLFNFAADGVFNIGYGNVVYGNNLVSNSQGAFVSPIVNVGDELMANWVGINGTSEVLWDNGSIGNYWSDYLARYPYATEVDSTGIGNTLYVLDSSNTDHYPLMNAVNFSSPQQSPTPSLTPIQLPTTEPSSTPNLPQENLASVAVIVGAAVAIVAVVALLAYISKHRGKK